jgi:hypothetical protein
MDRPFPPVATPCAWKKPAIFLPSGRNCLRGSGSTRWRRSGSVRLRRRTERRRALPSQRPLSQHPEGLSQIREIRAQACPLPRNSARRSPPPRTYGLGLGQGT